MAPACSTMAHTCVVLVGSCGSGKSTIATYITGVEFEADFCYDATTGVTRDMAWAASELFPGVCVFDTPGNNDLTAEDAAVAEIMEALHHAASMGAQVKLVFVATLDQGRTCNHKLAAMDQILKSLSMPDGSPIPANSYAVVFNQCKHLDKCQQGILNLRKYFSDPESVAAPTNCVMFVPFNQDLDAQRNPTASFDVTDVTTTAIKHKAAVAEKKHIFQRMESIARDTLDALLQRRLQNHNQLEAAEKNLEMMQNQCEVDDRAYVEKLEQHVMMIEEAKANIQPANGGNNEYLRRKIAHEEAGAKVAKGGLEDIRTRRKFLVEAAQRVAKLRQQTTAALWPAATVRKLAGLMRPMVRKMMSAGKTNVDKFVEEAVDDFAQKTKEAVHVAVDSTVDAVKDAVKTTGFGDDVEKMAETVLDQAKEEVTHKLENFVDSTAHKVETIVENAVDKLEHMATDEVGKPSSLRAS